MGCNSCFLAGLRQFKRPSLARPGTISQHIAIFAKKNFLHFMMKLLPSLKLFNPVDVAKYCHLGASFISRHGGKLLQPITDTYRPIPRKRERPTETRQSHNKQVHKSTKSIMPSSQMANLFEL